MNRTLQAIIGLLAMTTAVAVSAQSFPDRPIRIVLAFGAGGTGDIVTRTVGQKLAQHMARTVIFENRPGANGIVGTELVAKAPPDGYTLTLASNGTHGINSSKYSKLPYDPVKDFEAVALFGTVPYILAVRNGLPAKSVQEFVSLAKAGPGVISMGSVGSVSELGATLLAITTAVRLNMIPYKAATQALPDLMGNRLDSLMDTGVTLLEHIQAGSFRAIAVTSKQRHRSLPTVPTVSESGYPEYENVGWMGLVAPAGTPQTVITKLNAEINAALDAPDVRESVLQKGLEPTPSTPARFAGIIKVEVARWAKLYRDAKIAPE